MKYIDAGILLIILCTFSEIQSSEIFRFCNWSDPKLQDCLEKSIQQGIESLRYRDGMNLPSSDPFFVENIVLDTAKTSVKLDLKFNNVQVFGFSNLTVLRVDYNEKENILSFVSEHPRMILKGQYITKGNILVLSVFGEGDFVITTFDTIMRIEIHIGDGNGTHCIRIKKVVLTLKPALVKFDFKNLFNGDKILADTVLKTVNDNWDLVYNDVENGINKVFSESFEQVAKKLFEIICFPMFQS
ncbi:protein takeout-like [Diorhabda sublineata]|uniref:protein takeout-like n=1 Tax=Diorhabda sublineata TaxID=1163346 RepID=UPI0024E179D6|nr:protein takeout-like [Diorhabda sublineata]